MENLKGKNIVVTGATGGLGSSLVKRLWKLDANLFLISKTREKLLRTALRLKTKTVDKKFFIFDYGFSTLDFVDDLQKNLMEFFQCNIYAVINNAATQQPIGKGYQVEWDKFITAQNINLYSPIAIMRMVIPSMIANGGGRIINLSGGGSTNTRPNFSSYAMSKTALVRYSEILGDELREFNVNINCVSPGNMNTNMQQETLLTSGISEKEFDTATITLKQDKEMTKQKAIDLIEFLLSEESKNVSGLLISAVWDDWNTLKDYNYKDDKDKYKLRRVI